MAKKKKKVSAAKKKVRKIEKQKPAIKVTKLECQVCGYRVLVDRKCGCVEEHVLMCCGQPMQKVEAPA